MRHSQDKNVLIFFCLFLADYYGNLSLRKFPEVSLTGMKFHMYLGVPNLSNVKKNSHCHILQDIVLANKQTNKQNKIKTKNTKQQNKKPRTYNYGLEISLKVYRT